MSPDSDDPRPSRPRSVREMGGGPKGDEEREDAEPPRPTPVREAMDARRDEADDVEPPTVAVYRGEEAWIARVEGRVRTGFRGDSGVPLLHLTFAREDAPAVRRFEAYGVGRRLDDLNQAQLLELLERARPVEESWERSALFPETRKNRKGR